MNTKQENELERAKSHFFSGRLNEAYQIFRRYFDRIPFKAEPAHAEYIGYFSRTLLELGKDYELKFYLNALEKLYSDLKTPELAYQLAGIYCVGPSGTRNHSLAKQLLEGVIRDCRFPKIVVRAKMLLAFAYDAETGDTASCRRIIESIVDPVTPELATMVLIWKAKVLRDEKKYLESETLLHKILAGIDPKTDWKNYFYARNILTIQYIRTGEIEKANKEILQLKSFFQKKKLNSIKIALYQLEREAEAVSGLGVIKITQHESKIELNYAGKSFELKSRTNAEKLLLVLAEKGFLDRTSIIKLLFNRSFDEINDNKAVYYHVHSLRKLVKKLGIPSDAICLENDGYRLLPKVRFVEA